ncbi:MAG: deoxynucleoside kinase [Flavobacteriales bacterium]|nr:deoxynucleoside kinase [Flavobacteriales bacterium]|tara:strand:+ start:558 stop:1202 length:645 start_codon:yes stop_codon:yes gene_type:complete
MLQNTANKFITIEGNIGAGKTTLATMLANDLNFRLILENFSNNPFLEDFYSLSNSNTLALELSFLAERYNQLKKIQYQDIFQKGFISDYFFKKSQLFAQNNLSKFEIKLFNKLYKIMAPSLIKPDLLVFLYKDISSLQYNIRKRGRKYEQQISNNYLESIQSKYLDYLKKQKLFPAIILNTQQIDFVEERNSYDSIKKLILKKYSIGCHYLELA